jgi:glucose uptake protein
MIVFGEWSTTVSILFGCLALVCIIVGIVLTSLKDNTVEEKPGELKKGIGILIVSTIGYLVYVVIAQLTGVDGWSALFPQAIGMVIGGVLLTYKHKPFNKYALKNIIPGVVWAVGNLFLFLSQPKVGVATSFSLSQMGIIISTFGGILILGEKKTKRQMIGIIIGSALIIIGAVFLGLAKAS